MKKEILIATICAGVFTGCASVKHFMEKDLQEEDFVIGQLYVDEMVNETPVISKPNVVEEKPAESSTTTKSGKKTGKNPLGLEYSETDNEELYAAINSWIGTPYKYGGSTKKGIDCSGFVGQIFRQVYGVTLHRSSNEMQQDVNMVSKDQIQEGDILFFKNSKGRVSHVGIYLKDGLFAHASTSAGVCVSRTDDSYWSKHFYKAGRLKGGSTNTQL